MIIQNLSEKNGSYDRPIDKQVVDIWNQCLDYIRTMVHDQSYRTWFQPIRIISISDSIVVLQVPSQFFYDWLETHYPEVIRKAIETVMGHPHEVEYSIVHSTMNQIPEPTQVPAPSVSQTDQKVSITTPAFGKNLPDVDTKLNPRYNFQTFIEGDGNKFAKAAALAVAEKPGETAFNPLVIFGGTGLGKTHLMHGIGNFAVEQGTVKKIIYATSEQFTSNFIKSIQENQSSDFSAYYRNADLLLVDDIQFFSNKGKTQEEFFHTFNELHMNGKQIVLTCDRPPSEIKELEDRLLSRFQWGLVVDVQPPDFETRLAILQQHSEINHIDMPPEILEYLANNVTSSIRELEGSLNRIMAQASISGKEITLDFARGIIQKIAKNRTRAITIENIIKHTADYFNLPENELLAKNRKKEIAIARQIAMYLTKIYTNHTVKSIGLHFGGRDHATVIYSINTIEGQIGVDQKVAMDVKNIRKVLDQTEAGR